MKAIRNIATLAGVAMMFATLGASRASAQTFMHVHGSFQLPFQARWGSVNLAPNRYTFKVVGSGAARVVVLSSRNNKGDDPAYYITGVVGYPPPSTGKNELRCQRRGSVCVIQTLQLGVAGETLIFPTPESERIERAARGHKKHTQQIQAADAIQTVPILISGK